MLRIAFILLCCCFCFYLIWLCSKILFRKYLKKKLEIKKGESHWFVPHGLMACWPRPSTPSLFPFLSPHSARERPSGQPSCAPLPFFCSVADIWAPPGGAFAFLSPCASWTRPKSNRAESNPGNPGFLAIPCSIRLPSTAAGFPLHLNHENVP